MRVNVRCPVCRESLQLRLDVEPYLTHGQNGAKGLLTLSVGATGIEHTCGAAQEPTPVDTDTTLERALESVLLRYNVPTHLVHNGKMAKTVADRGDLSDSLAEIAREHLTLITDGTTIG